MLSTVIAIIGTLLGALLSGLLQHRAARSDRSHDEMAQLRREQMDAVTALAEAVTTHRRTMWELMDGQLTGADAARVQDLRDATHATRSAIAAPDVRTRLLVTNATVRTAATEAIQATYRMRDAADLDDLQDRRAAAVTAHDAFVDTMAAYLAA